MYTPPVTPWELVIPNIVSLTIRRAALKVGLVTGVKSYLECKGIRKLDCETYKSSRDESRS